MKTTATAFLRGGGHVRKELLTTTRAAARAEALQWYRPNAAGVVVRDADGQEQVWGVLPEGLCPQTCPQ